MTEAGGAGGGISRAEFDRRLIQRSMEDEDLRQKLLDDPKGILEQELGRRLPEGLEVRVVEESADTIYLVLPGASVAGEGGGELSDEELEAVAGGQGDVPVHDPVDVCGANPDVTGLLYNPSVSD
jgi:hypothetical protein